MYLASVSFWFEVFIVDMTGKSRYEQEGSSCGTDGRAVASDTRVQSKP